MDLRCRDSPLGVPEPSLPSLSRPTPDLCGTDNWFAGQVATSNHHLLSQEDLLSWDLDAQVTPCHHDAIAHFQDFIEPGELGESGLGKSQQMPGRGGATGWLRSR